MVERGAAHVACGCAGPAGIFAGGAGDDPFTLSVVRQPGDDGICVREKDRPVPALSSSF